MSSVVTRTPAGTPSQIATSARPCDSPAVSQRNMVTILRGQLWYSPAVWPGPRSVGSCLDADLDAPAHPAAQSPRQPVRRPIDHGPPVGDGQPERDREIRAVRAGWGQAEAGPRGLAGGSRAHQGAAG